MIPQAAIDAFLKAPRDDHRWLKDLDVLQLDNAIKALKPSPQINSALRLHQKVGILLGTAYPQFCFWYDMGSGKTILALELLRYWWKCKRLRRALVFVTSDKAFPTWEKQLKTWNIDLPFISLSASSSVLKWQMLEDFKEGLIFITYPGAVAMTSHRVKGKRGKNKMQLDPKLVKQLAKNVDAIVLDECFPAEALVATPRGDVPIEKLVVGEEVFTSVGVRRIKSVLRKHSSLTVLLRLNNGKEIRCTPNHPFFTDLGWVCAGNLKGRYLHDFKSVQQLRKNVPSQKYSCCEILQSTLLLEVEEKTQLVSKVWSKNCARPKLHAMWKEFSGWFQKKILQSSLLFRGEQGKISLEQKQKASSFKLRTKVAFEQTVSGKTCSPLRNTSLEQRSSNAFGIPRAFKTNISRYWTYNKRGKPWGKWPSIAKTSEISSFCIRPALGTGASHFIRPEAGWLSNLLQGRLSISEKEIGYRSGWAKPYWEKGQRLQERYQASGIRVESVTCKEFICPIDVFSLEIEDCPHFYVEGYLVHNSTKVAWDSLTSQLCTKLRKSAQFCYALAGRPFGRDPTMLWRQYFIVDGGQTLGETLGLFRAAFFSETENPWAKYAKDYTFKKRMMPELMRIVQHRSLSYAAEECIDVPEFQSIIEEVSLPEEASAYYQKIVDEIIAAQGNLELMKNAFLRMRQLSSGFLGFRNDKSERVEIAFAENPKLDRLLELIEAMPDDRGALIWYEFTASGRRIADALKALGRDVLWLWSGTKDAQGALRKFQSDPSQRFAVINNKVGAYSLDGLQDKANFAYVFESPLSVIDRSQAEKRLVRQGQQRKVFIYDLLVKGTLDRRILDFHKDGADLLKALRADPRALLEG